MEQFYKIKMENAPLHNNNLKEIVDYLKMYFDSIIDTVTKYYSNVNIEFRIKNNINTGIIKFCIPSNNFINFKDLNINVFELCIEKYFDEYSYNICEQLNLNKSDYFENKNPLIKYLLLSMIDEIIITC